MHRYHRSMDQYNVMHQWNQTIIVSDSFPKIPMEVCFWKSIVWDKAAQPLAVLGLANCETRSSQSKHSNKKIQEIIVKKTLVAILTVAFSLGSTVVSSSGGHKGGGSSNQNPAAGSVGVSGAPFDRPRGFGMEDSDEEHEEHENFSKKAAGAWGKGEGSQKDD